MSSERRHLSHRHRDQWPDPSRPAMGVMGSSGPTRILKLMSDQDGRSYDVAIDNVFATGYDGAGESVPTPLSTIQTGDRLELCGKLYTDGGPGIDWLHTNCGETPRAAQPDGWRKILSSDGAGPNLEDSREYCRLWR